MTMLAHNVFFALRDNAQEAKDDAAAAGDSNFRLLLFCLVTVMSLYCFYSQVIHNWGATSAITRAVEPLSS